MTDSELDAAIEAHIDATSINRVLESLMRVCMGKAEHLADNWQDASFREGVGAAGPAARARARCARPQHPVTTILFSMGE